MRHLLHALVAAVPVLLLAGMARAQGPPRDDAPIQAGRSGGDTDRPPLLPPVTLDVSAAGDPAGYLLPVAARDDRPQGSARLAQDELAGLQQDLAKLQGQFTVAQAAGAAQPDDPLPNESRFWKSRSRRSRR